MCAAHDSEALKHGNPVFEKIFKSKQLTHVSLWLGRMSN